MDMRNIRWICVGMEATSKNLNDLKLKKAHEDKVAAEVLADAQALAVQIEKESITLSIKMGENGRTFGSLLLSAYPPDQKSHPGLQALFPRFPAPPFHYAVVHVLSYFHP